MNRFNLPDLYITIPTILLLSLGILVIFISDPKLAIQQLIVALVGLLLLWLISFVGFETLKDINWILYVGVTVLLVVVFILGVETRGSLRWIPLGPFQLQPSELAKPIIILMLANFWSKNLPSWVNILKSWTLTLPILGLIFKQPDLGTSIVILTIWLMMLVGAQVSAGKLTLMSILGLVLTPIGWWSLKDYQKIRLLSFLSPQQDPLGLGYNVIQSTIAVGSGGLFGRGLGRGTQSRLQFLPEFRTDFIFASIAEEFGFLGSIVVLTLYLILLIRMLKVIGTCNNKFGNLIVLGVLSMIFIQVVVNIGMNIGIMPITGITLPLLSYGGSSVLVTLASLGLVSSVARFESDKKALGG